MTDPTPAQTVHAAAPSTVTLIACPVCGRTDRWIQFKMIGKHYSRGARCYGRPERVFYDRRPTP